MNGDARVGMATFVAGPPDRGFESQDIRFSFDGPRLRQSYLTLGPGGRRRIRCSDMTQGAAVGALCQRPAASRSTHQITRPSVSRTPAAGYVSGSGTPVRTSWKARAFVDPVTRTDVLAPRVRAGR